MCHKTGAGSAAICLRVWPPKNANKKELGILFIIFISLRFVKFFDNPLEKFTKNFSGLPSLKNHDSLYLLKGSFSPVKSSLFASKLVLGSAGQNFKGSKGLRNIGRHPLLQIS